MLDPLARQGKSGFGGAEAAETNPILRMLNELRKSQAEYTWEWDTPPANDPAPDHFSPALDPATLEAIQARARGIMQAAEPRLPTKQKNISRRLYRILLEATLIVITQARKGSLPPQAVNRGECVVLSELVASGLGICRRTYDRGMAALEKAGLIHRRPIRGSMTNYDTGEIMTVATGTLVDVVLSPERQTTAYACAESARTYGRDMDADRARGATAYRWLQWATETRAKLQETQQRLEETSKASIVQSLKEQIENLSQSLQFLREENISSIIYRITVKKIPSTPVAMTATTQTVGQNMPYFAGLIANATGEVHRRQLISLTARSIATTLDDEASQAFWGYILTQAAKLHLQGIQALYMLQDSYERILNDMEEWDGMRCKAAIFISRLKSGNLWPMLQQAA